MQPPWNEADVEEKIVLRDEGSVVRESYLITRTMSMPAEVDYPASVRAAHDSSVQGLISAEVSNMQSTCTEVHEPLPSKMSDKKADTSAVGIIGDKQKPLEVVTTECTGFDEERDDAASTGKDSYDEGGSGFCFRADDAEPPIRSDDSEGVKKSSSPGSEKYQMETTQEEAK